LLFVVLFFEKKCPVVLILACLYQIIDDTMTTEQARKVVRLAFLMLYQEIRKRRRNMENTSTMELCQNTRRMESVLAAKKVTHFQMYAPSAMLMSEEGIASLFLSMHDGISEGETIHGIDMEFA
jgi:hypothetical protein